MTLNQYMPGLDIDSRDIDRAHRLPGQNNRVIARFMRLGQGSIRDHLMMRRLELHVRDLFVNESNEAGEPDLPASSISQSGDACLHCVLAWWKCVIQRETARHRDQILPTSAARPGVDVLER